MTNGNMRVEEKMRELEKRVKELERKWDLVAERESAEETAIEAKREWFRKANERYFTRQRVLSNAIDKILTGKDNISKILKRLEKRIPADILKPIYDMTDDREIVGYLARIKAQISEEYKNDKEVQELLRTAQEGRRVVLYLRGKVVEELKKDGKFKPLTFEEIRRKYEENKDEIEKYLQRGA